MSSTTMLVQVIGPAFLLLGIGMLTQKEHYMKAFKAIEDGGMFLVWASVINLVVGLSLMLTHWDWSSLPAGIVSFIGLGAFLKGVHMTLAPNSWRKMVGMFMQGNMLMYGAVVATVVGLYLCYVGYLT